MHFNNVRGHELGYTLRTWVLTSNGDTTATLVADSEGVDDGSGGTTTQTINNYVNLLEGVAKKANSVKTSNIRFISRVATTSTKGVVLQNNVNIVATGTSGYNNIDLTEGMDFTQSIDASKYKGNRSGKMTVKAGTNFQTFVASAYADDLTLSTVEGSQQVTYTFTSQKGYTDTITLKLGAADAAGAKSQLAEIQHANNLQIGSVKATLGGSRVIANYVTTAARPVNAGSVELVDEANEGGNFKYSVQFTTTEAVNASTGLNEYHVTANYFVQTAALGTDAIQFGTDDYTTTVKDEADAWRDDKQDEVNDKSTSAGNDAYYSYQLTLDVPDGDDALSVMTDTTNQYTTTLSDTNINVIVKRQDGVYSVDRVIYEDGDELASVAAVDNKATIFGDKGLPGGIGGLFTLEFSNVSNTNLDVKYNYDYNEETDYEEQVGDVSKLTASNDYATIEQTRTFERSALKEDSTAKTLTITAGTGEQKAEKKRTAPMTLGTLSTATTVASAFGTGTIEQDSTQHNSFDFKVGTYTLSTNVESSTATINATATAQLHTASGSDVNITTTDATSTTLTSATFTNSTSALANNDNSVKATVSGNAETNGTARTAFAIYSQDQRTQPITITFGTVDYEIELDFTGSYTTNAPGIKTFRRKGDSSTNYNWDSTSSEASVTSADGITGIKVKLVATGSRIDASWTPKVHTGTINIGTDTSNPEVTMTIEYETDEFGNSKSTPKSVNGIEIGADGTFTVEAGTKFDTKEVKADTAFDLNAKFDATTKSLTWTAASLTGSAKLFEDATNTTALTVEYGIDVFGNSDITNVTKINGQDVVDNDSGKTITIDTTGNTFNPAQATTFSLSGDHLEWNPIVNEDYFTIGGGTYTMIYDVDAFGNSKTDLKTIQYGSDADATINPTTSGTDITFTIGTNFDSVIAAATNFTIKSDSSAVEWSTTNKTGSIQFGTEANTGMVDIIYAEDKFGNSTYEIASLNSDTDADADYEVTKNIDENGAITSYTFKLDKGPIGTDASNLVNLYADTTFTITSDNFEGSTAAVKWNPTTNTEGTVVLVEAYSDITKFGLVYETDDFGNSTDKIDSLKSASDATEVYDVTSNQFEMANTWLGTDKNTTFSIDKTSSPAKVTWTPWLSTGAEVVLASDATLAQTVKGSITYRTDAYGNSINEIGAVKINDDSYEVATDTNTFTITADSINGYGHDKIGRAHV